MVYHSSLKLKFVSILKKSVIQQMKDVESSIILETKHLRKWLTIK